ncbi:Hypothetical protein, putative [Bodo saltans]|uniref:Uncharacterized protein n=1 Tax=Bodo saltans TaxID=75058 RepID=A0A0S4IUR4_BODSA|nr:Hypothetical protein, putative [Bodo saltans]|eukprot:CUF98897.1 Hypothetical protein, putative [Bodo saltans]
MTTELKSDPRTGLDIVEIPVTHAKYFGDLKGSLIHWFGDVEKFNRMWRVQKRVCIVTDVCIYLCRIDGSITRCAHIQGIQEAIVTDTALGLRIGPPDYDMLIKFDKVKDREDVLHVLSKVYWCVNGQQLERRQLNSESGEAMQQVLNLTKPENFVNRVEPLKSTRALQRLMEEKRRREEEDRMVVEQEFERIKEGLALELQKYRSEEYDKMAAQLASYVKLLNDKDRQIDHLKATSVSLNDPDVWKKCPNCANYRKMLESHPNEDKQKNFRLQREIESQRHIVEHLQAAIQHRSGVGRGGGSGGDLGGSSMQVAALKAELAESSRKNKELQHLLLESPMLTSEVRDRIVRLLSSSSDGAETAERVLLNGRDAVDVLHEKEREIQHLKSTLRDATFRHVQELEACREQIQRYDEQVVSYVSKIQQMHNQQSSMLMGDSQGSPSRAANFSATDFQASTPRQQRGSANPLQSYALPQALQQSPIRNSVASPSPWIR